jgi:DNA-binding NarL/FixJ family response regulator
MPGCFTRRPPDFYFNVEIVLPAFRPMSDNCSAVEILRQEKMTGPIRLLILDDHSLFREGLARLLTAESDFLIVGNCAQIEEALEVLKREDVDLILLDYDLGASQGSQLLEATRKMGITPKVLMVTAGMSSAGMLNVMEHGASGIFLKHSPPGQLAEAIRRVMEGEMWLDPRAVKPVITSAARASEQRSFESKLSEREKTVLKGVLEGASNKSIASTLHMSESSVKAVLQQLFGKAGVRTRSQLVRLALERHSNDWLSEDSE